MGPVASAFEDAATAVGNGVVDAGNAINDSVIKPAGDGIVDAANKVNDSVIDPAGSAIVDAANTIADQFDTSENKYENSSFSGFSLAHCYGTLTKESFLTMDAFLIVALVSTIQSSKDIVSWDKLLETMNNNPKLYKDDNSIDKKEVIYRRESTDFMKVDGSPDSAIVNEVITKLNAFIADDDIITDLKVVLGQNVLNDIVSNVAETGASVNNIGSVFVKDVTVCRNIMESGVLRFPDINHPYFKLHHLKIKSYRYCKRILSNESNNCELEVELHSVKYFVKSEDIPSDVLALAIADAEAIFNF